MALAHVIINNLTNDTIIYLHVYAQNKFNDFASLFLAHKKEYSLTLVKSRKKKTTSIPFSVSRTNNR